MKRLASWCRSPLPCQMISPAPELKASKIGHGAAKSSGNPRFKKMAILSPSKKIRVWLEKNLEILALAEAFVAETKL
ncbi:MAG: hypothetical protein F6J93_10925 [Oscillatoria sp. SIO1A7]|nr:hypothetical protein [Oscillatoria sp. SIO1A7]